MLTWDVKQQNKQTNKQYLDPVTALKVCGSAVAQW